MGIDAAVECGVRQKICTNCSECPGVLCDEFAASQTAIFSVLYGKLHYGDLSVLRSKSAGLQFGLVKHIHGAQYLLG